MRKKDTGFVDSTVWAGVSYEGSIVADAIMSDMDAEQMKKVVTASEADYKKNFNTYANSLLEEIFKDIDSQIYEAAQRGEYSITYYLAAAIKDKYRTVFTHFVTKDMVDTIYDCVRNRYGDLHYSVSGDVSEVRIYWR